MQLWVITRLLLLVVLANAMPVVAKKVLGDRFSRPLDGDARCRDGQPLFGASKTMRGILLSVLATVIGAYLSGLGYKTGAMAGTTAIPPPLPPSFFTPPPNPPPPTPPPALHHAPAPLSPPPAPRPPLPPT